MPLSRKRSATHSFHWKTSNFNQQRHLRECKERDAQELAKATEVKGLLARVRAGIVPMHIVDVMIAAFWPDHGILAGIYRHSRKWRIRKHFQYEAQQTGK